MLKQNNMVLNQLSSMDYWKSSHSSLLWLSKQTIFICVYIAWNFTVLLIHFTAAVQKTTQEECDQKHRKKIKNGKIQMNLLKKLLHLLDDVTTGMPMV